jgi:hypothetical protein
MTAFPVPGCNLGLAPSYKTLARIFLSNIGFPNNLLKRFGNRRLLIGFLTFFWYTPIGFEYL